MSSSYGVHYKISKSGFLLNFYGNDNGEYNRIFYSIEAYKNRNQEELLYIQLQTIEKPQEVSIVLKNESGLEVINKAAKITALLDEGITLDLSKYPEGKYFLSIRNSSNETLEEFEVENKYLPKIEPLGLKKDK
jgi:hypothetical protein